MKFSIFLLLIIITSLYADQPHILRSRHIQGIDPVVIGDMVYSQAFGSYINGIGINSGSNQWLCDDFVLDGCYYLTDIYTWMIWTSMSASTMNLVISEDDLSDSDPNTNTDVWVESVPCINTYTGYSVWGGYDLYETRCIIDADLYPELDEGIHYYFEMQAEVTDGCFTFVSDNYIGDSCWYDNGGGVWVEGMVYFEVPTDMFFVFYGEPLGALESETWGSIKTLF